MVNVFHKIIKQVRISTHTVEMKRQIPYEAEGSLRKKPEFEKNMILLQSAAIDVEKEASKPSQNKTMTVLNCSQTTAVK